MGLIAAGLEAHSGSAGGIFVRRGADVGRGPGASMGRPCHVSDGREPLRPDQSAPWRSAIPRLKPARTHPDEAAKAGRGETTCCFQRTGRIQPRRARVCDHDFAQDDAGSMVNVCDPHFGTVVAETAPLHLERERARVPSHALSTDSVSDTGGERLSSRRRERTFLVPAPFHSRGRRPITRHGFGYSIFEHAEAGISSELIVCVDLHAAVKFSVRKCANVSGRSRRLSAPDTWSGSSGIRPKSRCTSLRKWTGERCPLPATHTTSSSPTGLPSSAWTVRPTVARPHRVPGRNGALRNRRYPPAPLQQGGSGSGSPAAIQFRSSSPTVGPRDHFRKGAREGAVPMRFETGARFRDGRCPRFARVQKCRGDTSAPCRWKRRTRHERARQRLALPDPACRLGRSGHLIGRRIRLPRSAADAMALIHATRACCASTCPLCGSPVPTEMSSIGGIPRRAAGFARAARTITSGCPWRRAATSGARATAGCWTSPFTSSRAGR